MTPSDFSAAMFRASDGDVIVYHRGHLQKDRQDRFMERRRREALNELAKDVMDAAASGFGRLVQRRHGPDDYEYLFVRAVATDCPKAPGLVTARGGVGI